MQPSPVGQSSESLQLRISVGRQIQSMAPSWQKDTPVDNLAHNRGDLQSEAAVHMSRVSPSPSADD